MQGWRKTSWADNVKNEEVLRRAKEKGNILQTIKMKANWISHNLRRNCILKHVTEEKIEVWIEVTGRRGRKRKQLLDDLKEIRAYCIWKEEELDSTLWRTRFGIDYGPITRETTE
jgi:replicative superfamily II helicase